jgi:Ca2+/Na+ antiporter
MLADNGGRDAEALLPTSEGSGKFRKVLLNFFKTVDTSGDGTLDKTEVAGLLQKMHVREDANKIFKAMDKDESGTIDFDEFVGYLEEVMRGDNGPSDPNRRRISSLRSNFANYGAINNVAGESQGDGADQEDFEGEEEEEEEEEEIPEDLADLPPDVQQRRIIMRSLYMMGLGTVLVLLFSDPMVDVMSNLGTVMNLKPFYISFVLAPLASNASELIASYNYALKKTSKTITISLTALEGAAIMNNTFCLGIFLALVYFRRLEWEFAAETISILFVQLCVIFIAIQKVQTMKHAMFVITLFPISIVLVAFFEVWVFD